MAGINEIIRRVGLTLAQAVKAAGLAETGGQGKFIIREGQIRVNGVPETKPGAQLKVGDRIAMDGEPDWIVTD